MGKINLFSSLDAASWRRAMLRRHEPNLVLQSIHQHMKATVYKMTLSNGKRVDVTGQSAGEAIEHARRTYRGQTVASCYSGNTEEDTALHRTMCDKQAVAGLIQHDIPPHEPIPEGVEFTRPRRTDNTASMFDDVAIAYESGKAKNNFERP